ncbi:hypothetical protein O6H91_04G008500 [Diphasiastrum complanatum]|uniref:Uncharacterized protein n=1 Tax=Diphasiastrum complanatum TaxID=34168 RepID=A0ACC2DU42_DIPCM|nr:hypothetical protein O6H91_04G008500 [Diphasiastrum complanatum]
MVSAFKYIKNFSILNVESISLPVHLSLPFFPAKFKCLLFGLLSSLGEVLNIVFFLNFSPHLKACILWKLVDELPSLLSIFYGEVYFEQHVHFALLPPLCKSCLSLSHCSCARASC